MDIFSFWSSVPIPAAPGHMGIEAVCAGTPRRRLVNGDRHHHIRHSSGQMLHLDLLRVHQAVLLTAVGDEHLIPVGIQLLLNIGIQICV